MNLEQALKNTTAPGSIIDSVTLLEVEHFGYDNIIHIGHLVVNKALTEEVKIIFDLLLQNKFPIEKIIPISEYNFNDELSMRDNNSSCFNYRTIAGTERLSKHAFGNAIDINPRYNPYINGTKISPINGIYDNTEKGTILQNSSIVQIFKSFGWTWGGDWVEYKDYQHFEK
ncbi:MAG: M15 family metallopeptidase [Bacteroidota bacterium]